MTKASYALLVTPDLIRGLPVLAAAEEGGCRVKSGTTVAVCA
jgi:hypothetical protein